MNQINSLMKTHGIEKREKGQTVLETEEAGFSAVEEDFHSPKVNARPIVYAGMSTKYEKYPYNEGVITSPNEEYFDSKQMRD
jgi:hypothetical protein